MTKEKALYQAKLVIENLSDEEYALIPEEFLEYVNSNYEYDENITINPDIPLEQQQIDEKTYVILDEMLSRIDSKNIVTEDTDKKVIDDNSEFLKSENIRLNSLIEMLQTENSKIPRIKELVTEYKTELEKKTNEIELLKQQNSELYSSIKKTPWLIRKMFFKDFENKLLK